jgi:hypothetical protein
MIGLQNNYNWNMKILFAYSMCYTTGPLEEEHRLFVQLAFTVPQSFL